MSGFFILVTHTSIHSLTKHFYTILTSIMYHKQLVEHIINKKKSGMPDEEIKKELIKDNWSKKDIDIGFYYAESPEKLKRFSLSRFLQSEVKVSSFLLVLIVAILSLVAVTFIYSQTRPGGYDLSGFEDAFSDRPAFTYGVSQAMSRPDFFNEVRSKFIESRTTFVEVNLTQMTVRVYTDGAPTLEVPIKTKGKPGSWWETPAGLYKIQTKEKTHYSTIGHVTQPWSMQFQGNFFIHGIPYYDDGTKVSSSFSGGCVRIEDEDAKKIFDQVSIGTPVLVYERNFSPDDFSYTKISPDIQAQSYLFADLNNNFVFLKNNESQVVQADFATKLMTALIATEYINIEKPIEVPAGALIDTSIPRLSAGMKTNVYQLLFPLLRESSNEAGEAIALSYGKAQFVRHMNEKARAIGMTHTTFVDPTGVSEENVSTAEDMFMLAKYIYNNRSFIFNITSGKVRTNTYGESTFTNLGSTNSMSNERYFFGGIGDEKNIENQNNLSVLEIKNDTSVRPIFFVSLMSKDPKTDIQSGIDYLLTHYK